eukprot:SM000178S03442  [mRNA]  locus=s178:48325:52502:+ [translate_table: standard]
MHTAMHGRRTSSTTSAARTCYPPPRAAHASQNWHAGTCPSSVAPGVNESLLELLREKGGSLATLPLPGTQEALQWTLALALALWYLTAQPGPIWGLLDFFYAPLHSLTFKSFSPTQVEVGRQLGEGSFGIVYEGFFGAAKGKSKDKRQHVVLKKVKANVRDADEMGVTELYTNQRLQRTAPGACADFLGTMEVREVHARGKLSQGLWLVWRYQGDRTLDHYMRQSSFPENIAEYLLGPEAAKVEGKGKKAELRRNVLVVLKIMGQLLSILQSIHRTGVVHRDVKPSNLIVVKDKWSIKLIDLGAAVDLRTGRNYVANETVMDPKWAAPEDYVMPTSTWPLPPDPLCSLLSPLLFLANTPDRFDLYSAGLVLLQMCLKPLRIDAGLVQFNSELRKCKHDLDKWRRKCRYGESEFAMLDADGGAGWELVQSLLQLRHNQGSFIWPSFASGRPSAAGALRHRFFQGPLASNFLQSWPKETVMRERQVVAKKQKGEQWQPQAAAASDFWSAGLMTVKEGEQQRQQRSMRKDVEVQQIAATVHYPTPPEGGRLAALASAFKLDRVNSRAAEPLEIVDVEAVETRNVEKLPEPMADRGDANATQGQGRLPSLNWAELPSHLQRLGPPLLMGAGLASGMTVAGLAVRSATVATYEMGRFTAASLGLSTTSLLVFLFLVKPWLQQQVKEASEEARRQRSEAVQVASIPTFPCFASDPLVIGNLAKAVAEMETQMAALEASIHAQRSFADQQQSLLAEVRASPVP